MNINQEVKSNPRSNELDQRVMTVTPALAERWLTMNKNNRRLRPSHVTHLANQMKQGRWMLSPEPIVFSKRGRLLDGQHRLNAVIQSGCDIKASVALVENEEVFSILDQGLKRTNSDILDIPSQVVMPVQFLLKVSVSAVKITPQDIDPLMQSRIGELSKYIHEEIKPRDKRFKSATFRAAYIMAVDLGIADKDKATEVFYNLSHMEMNKWSGLMQNLFHQFEANAGSGGQQMSNPYFMRGLYMFSSIGTNRTTVRVTSQFEKDMAAKIRQRIRSIHTGGKK